MNPRPPPRDERERLPIVDLADRAFWNDPAGAFAPALLARTARVELDLPVGEKPRFVPYATIRELPIAVAPARA